MTMRLWKAAALLLVLASTLVVAMLPGAAFAASASASEDTAAKIPQILKPASFVNLNSAGLSSQSLDPWQAVQCPTGATVSGTFTSNHNCWWAYFEKNTYVSAHATTYEAGTLLIGAGPEAYKTVSEHARYKIVNEVREWDGSELPWIAEGKVDPAAIKTVMTFGMIKPDSLVWNDGLTQGDPVGASWFGEAYVNLENFDGRGINTSGCTCLSGLLANAGSQLNGKYLMVDLSGWDTSSVTDFSHAFKGCSKMASLDISTWNMSKVTKAGSVGMLEGCSSLVKLKVHQKTVLKYDSNTNCGLSDPSVYEGAWIASTDSSAAVLTDAHTTEWLVSKYPKSGTSYGTATWKWVDTSSGTIVKTIKYKTNGYGKVCETIASSGKDSFTDEVLLSIDIPNGAWAVPNDGYNLDGWYCGSSLVSKNVHLTQADVDRFAKSSGMYSSTTFEAVFVPNVYHIVYNANDGTWTTSLPYQAVTYDKAVNLATATGNLARSGFTFSGWNTAANGSGTSYREGQSVKNLTTQNFGDQASPYGEVHLYAQWTAIPASQQTSDGTGTKEASSTKESSTKESSSSKGTSSSTSTTSNTASTTVTPVTTGLTPTTPTTPTATNTNTSNTTQTSTESTSRSPTSGSNDSTLNVAPVSSSPIVTQGADGSGGLQGNSRDATSGQGENLVQEFANMSSAQKARVVSNAVTTVATVSVFAGGASILGVAGTAGASGVADLAAELAAESSAAGSLFGRRRRKKEEEDSEADAALTAEG